VLGSIAFGLAIVFLAGCLGAQRLVGQARTERPNVLIILVDDMRSDGLWALPTLQRLAERGVTFSRHFVTTPLCCPSRASILTGRYARNHGVLANNPPLGGAAVFDDSSTLATWLQSAGVRTGLIGRYLNGYASESVPRGWDFWFALWQANEQYSNYYNYRVTDNGTRRFYGSREEMYSTRILAEQATRFLGEETNRPFMLFLAPRAPHGSPATPDHLDAGTYKELDFPLPPSYNEADVSDKPRRLSRLASLSKDTLEELEIIRRRQFEALAGVDRALGRIVETLRGDGRLGKTWIIFTSDNGLTLGEHRRDVHKSCPYEECSRVPLVIIPPDSWAGRPRVESRLVANIDLAPTIVEIMSVQPSAQFDGRSLLPVLDESSAGWRDALVLEMLKDEDGDRFQAIRTPDRKYVRYPDGEEELYDEESDPYELENLAADPSRADEKARLIERLEALLTGPSSSGP
jgi:arylsulfatase A-like enzyme